MCYSAMVQQNLKYLKDTYGVHIIRETFDDYERLSAVDPKTYKPLEENPRIFPFYFAPVIYSNGSELVTEPMRYQAWPPDHKNDPKTMALYNARLDNLRSPFWQSMFMKRHGFIVSTAFYEWVKVSDVIKTEKIRLRDVESEFLRLSQERRKKKEAEGKPFKPTPTEKLPAIERKIIVRFFPTRAVDILMPVIIAEHKKPDGSVLKSFAVVTTDPPPEISLAGHDRSPVNLQWPAMQTFITPPLRDPDAMEKLLSVRPNELYDCDLAE